MSEPVVITFPFISAEITKAAEATGVSETTIREAILAGDLTAHYVGKRATKPVLMAADLHEWVASLPVHKRRAS